MLERSTSSEKYADVYSELDFAFSFICIGADFVSHLDLKVACLIQQKQVEHIRAQKSMIIPHERMRQVREDEMRAQEGMLFVQ